MNYKSWIAATIMGVGGSALALFLFTASFKFINPSISILLQKLHPIFAIIIANLFLGEKISKPIWVWGGVAFLLGIFLGFTEIPGSEESSAVFKLFGSQVSRGDAIKGLLLSLSATILWSSSTSASRHMSQKTGFLFSMALRFALGFLGLFVLCLIFKGWTHLSETFFSLKSGEGTKELISMTLVSGLLAMTVYYKGIKTTKAQVATFLESLWPVFAAVLNWIYFGLSMGEFQIILGILLLFSVYRIQSKISSD